MATKSVRSLIRKSYKEKPFQNFHIHCGVYDYGINVIVSEDATRCAEYVNRKFEIFHITGDDFDCLGKVFSKRGMCPILWMPRVPSSPKEQGTLSHECLHIVFEIMSWAGIPYSTSSEEAYTHLLKYLYTSFFDNVKS